MSDLGIQLYAGQGRRFCIACGRRLKLDNFTKQQGTCDSCVNERESRQRQIKKGQDADSLVKSFLKSLRKQSALAPHISEVTIAMLERFGGLDKFCDRWYSYIERMETEHDKPSKAVADCFRDIVKLVLLSTEHQDSVPEIDMDENEMQVVLGELFRRNVEQQKIAESN